VVKELVESRAEDVLFTKEEYSPDMPKDPRVDEILVTLARIDERFKYGGVIVLALAGWLGWLTNKVTSGPVSLAGIASSPVTEQTVKKANQLVTDALQVRDRSRISAYLVRGLGENLISASAGTDQTLAREAWSTTVQLINYRSLLNANLNPIPPNTPIRTINEFLFVIGFANPDGMKVGDAVPSVYTVGDDVPIEQAARLETLGKDINAGRTMGPRVIVMSFQSNPIKLDGSWYKNVIVKDTKVVYSGGQTKLENVYFINCEFKMENLPPSRTLGELMIANATVSFDGTLLPGEKVAHISDRSPAPVPVARLR
jgi:hypothetical protein